MVFFYSNGKDDRPLELFKILGTIAVDGGALAIKTLNGVGNAAKLVAAGVAAGATAIAALTKQAVESYAEYEQLVGGVETLFGTGGKYITEYAESVGKSVDEVRDEYQILMQSQKLVMDNAAKAYKDAGMSASEYMETVTSFSASLLQSLGGDTVAAAKYADMAIIDMSDNANKMGTDISSIQSAYQGFAKQNYTMLDNLKLGYGGTKEEMERLLREAEKINEKNGIYTKYTISNYADIVDAIHVVQEEMGIAGTTAKEASETIAGSVASAKASWKNLLVGMADNTADMEKLVDQFVDAVDTAAQNIIPRVEIALEGAGKLIDRLFPRIVEKIPSIINDTLPKILNSAVNIVITLVNGISDNKDTIMATIFDVVMVIIQTVTDLLPQIFELGLELLLTVATGIIENLDGLVTSAIEMVNKIVETILEPDTLDKLLDATIGIILAFADGLVRFIPELITAAVTIITKLIEYLLEEENLKKIIDSALTLMEALINGLLESTGLLVEAAAEITAAFIEAIINVDWWDVGKRIITGIGEGIINSWSSFQQNHPWVAELFSNSAAVFAAGGYGNASFGTLNMINGSHASGLDYVPYDGYIAELHKGEMVVPANEARMLRNGTNAADNSNVENLLAMILDAVTKWYMREPVIKFKEREVARMVREYA